MQSESPKCNLNVGVGIHLNQIVTPLKLNCLNIDVIRLPSVDVVCDVQHLPFRKRVFKNVYCFHVLEHLDNPARALSELCRVTDNLLEIEVPHFLSHMAKSKVRRKELHGFINSKTTGLIHQCSFRQAWFHKCLKNYVHCVKVTNNFFRDLRIHVWVYIPKEKKAMVKNTLKVALVSPKSNIGLATCAPYGLGYIASYLTSQIPSCKITIIDGEAGHNVEDELARFQPDIIGVSASTAQATQAYHIGDTYRLNNPDVLTVIGGVHCSALPDEALEHFDCVVVGEGEIVFTRIVQDFIDGKQVYGIKQGVEIEDLNTLPPIDYSLLDIEKYLTRCLDYPLLSDKCLSFGTSRGCPYTCPFCYNSGRTTKVRYFNAKWVANEILYFHKKYGIDKFYFTDDEFLINTQRLKELKEVFEREGISKWIKWGCASRSKTLNKNTLKQAKSAGCILITIGLESGCEETLHYLKKGTTTLSDHEEALKNCADVGILAGGNFIYGTFNQTLKEMQQSYSWATKQRNISFISTGVLIPYPGTEVWQKSRSLRLLPETVDYNRLVLTNLVKSTYVLNQNVPIKDFSKFMLNTARMTRLYARRNYLKSSWRFIKEMIGKPVFYWACLFHPLQMIKILFRRN